ncbi:LysR family transcriptional regulator [Paucibacter sediminis]|uniref:LysR family transcriptional regulator n=1 Tax=Paucibacter sediminis TaxID=3019553 RepID=A0AA95NI98_9BURK|nr:LysR family transcriptional regulator [Paucibacter sp. S2-9]WIT12933.1 LysR family transcriptional regulator [Paucibacter sp. S2-9]
MDHLDSLRCFVAVAELGSLAAGARRLGLSAPTATRALAALEARLGSLLLQRSTRSLRLTEVGERFLQDCRRILADLDEAEGQVAGLQHEASGVLAVTASAMFGRLHVVPILMEFLQAQPRVQLRSLFVDRIVHLQDEGMDVAIRIARLPDSGLTALRVGSLRRLVVASPDYLARHGEPRSPQDLTLHRAVGFSFDGLVPEPWAFGPDAARVQVQPRMDWVANTSEIGIAAALAGHGLTRGLAYQVAEHVQSGALRIVLAEFERPPVPVHIVYPAGRRAPAKVRAFIELAGQRLRAEPILQGGGLG